jgi:endonuclease G
VPDTNDIIVREIYTLSSNDLTKFADWVAYKITPDTIGSGCTRRWKSDPNLDPSETLEPEDYKYAHDTLHTDRGHQVPLASFCNVNSWRETNYLSNITPQKSNLNQRSWQYLEAKVRDLVKTGAQAYVLTGPLYEKIMPSLPGADEVHMIPSGYWKLVMIDENRNLSLASFIFEQNKPANEHFCQSKASYAELTMRTKLSLLPDLPDHISVNEDLYSELCPHE